MVQFFIAINSINRLCLSSLEAAAESVTEPKEIKIIVEAASAAILAIRKIYELDEPALGKQGDEELSEEELDAELKKRGLSRSLLLEE